MYIRSLHDECREYAPAVTRWSLYKSLWLKYNRQFLDLYPEKFSERFGILSSEKIDEMDKLIACGEFRNGFVIHSCTQCGTKLVVPFTCKSRLCLSCRRKSLFGWSVNLSELMDVSMRHVHVTFTIPGRIIKIIAGSGFDEMSLVTLAAGTFLKIMRMSMVYDRKYMMPGVLAVLHKCGNSLNYNPHVHLVGTVDMVHLRTGEVINTGFILPS
jgi:hypothetical protein